MVRFKNQVAVVTGGASGIGLATAQAFAREGATVIIAGRRAAEGERALASLKVEGAEAAFIQTDVTVETEVANLFTEIHQRYGRLDIAFNNAGHEGVNIDLTELDEPSWDAAIDVNLKSVWLCMKYEIQEMRKQGSGSIVNMSTNIAHIGSSGMGVYSAAKAGVLALTRAAALENSKAGLRINAVSPGPIGTPMGERLFGSIENQKKLFSAKIPLGRIGMSEEVAAAVLWLCTSDSSLMVGRDLILDGGFSIQ